MNTRLVFLMSVVLAGSALTLSAQTRRTIGTTREDQHPASSSTSTSRGEQRSPEPASPPPHHDSSPQPVSPTGPGGPHPHPPGPGVPFDGGDPIVIMAPFSPAVSVPAESVPLWPVMGTEILDRVTDPENSGYDFDDGDIVAFDDNGADVFYESQDSLLHGADDTDVQDLGVAKSVREDLRVRRDGWVTARAIRVQPGHQYAVWRWNGDVVRLYVQEVVDGAVVFDWMPGRSIERTGVQGPIFGR